MKLKVCSVLIFIYRNIKNTLNIRGVKPYIACLPENRKASFDGFRNFFAGARSAELNLKHDFTDMLARFHPRMGAGRVVEREGAVDNRLDAAVCQ